MPWPAILAVLAITMTSTAFHFLFAEPQAISSNEPVGPSAAGNPIYVAFWFVLWIGAGAATLRSLLRHGLERALASVFPILALVLASALWSVAPARTLYFGAMLSANILVAFALATAMSPDRFLVILGRTLGAFLLISVALLPIAASTMMTERYSGGIQFRGVFPHKSLAGPYLGLLLLVIVSGVDDLLRPSLRVLAGLATLLALVMTNSVTGLATALGLSIFLVMTHAFPRRLGAIVAVWAGGITAFALAMPLTSLGDAAELLGRDVGLTGRDTMWGDALGFFSERPLLGYGYYAFFDTGPESPAQRLWANSPYFKTPNFHNVIIDVGISLGLAGLLTYAVLLVGAILVIRNETISPAARRLCAAILLALILASSFDFLIMAHNTLPTLVVFYVFFAAQMSYARAGA